MGVGAVSERAGPGGARLGVAAETPVQAVCGAVQQLHPDAPRPEELAGGGSATCRRRTQLLPASLPIRDVHPNISGRALCQRDAAGGQRVQVSHRVSVSTHNQSRIQVEKLPLTFNFTLRF